jgi:hypothetical protein
MFLRLEAWELEYLQECPLCGAVIRNTEKHEEWHAEWDDRTGPHPRQED